jgi:hypothetical protein
MQEQKDAKDTAIKHAKVQSTWTNKATGKKMAFISYTQYGKTTGKAVNVNSTKYNELLRSQKTVESKKKTLEFIKDIKNKQADMNKYTKAERQVIKKYADRKAKRDALKKSNKKVYSITARFNIAWNGNVRQTITRTFTVENEDGIEHGIELCRQQIEDNNEYRGATVESNGDASVVAMKASDLTNQPMFASINPFTKEGTCVYDYVLKEYKKQIPSLTHEKLFAIFHSIDYLDHTNAQMMDKFMNRAKHGVSTSQTRLFCQKYNIPMKAFDYDGKCFELYEVEKKTKYRSLIFKMMNNHMYPIADPKTRQSLTQKCVKVKTGIIKGKEEKKEEYQPFPVVVVDSESFDVLQHIYKEPTRVVLTKVQDLTDSFATLLLKDPSLFETYDQAPMGFFNGNMSYMTYKNSLFATNQHYHEVKHICEKLNIDFKNQPLITLTQQIFEKEHTLIKSSYNSEVAKIIDSEEFHRIAFNEVYEIPKNYENVKAFDINKAFMSFVMNNKYDYPVYSIFDKPQAYDGELKTGMYFVISKNHRPLRGNGWYSRETVQYCIDNKIKHKITHQLISSKAIPADYFNDFFIYLKEHCTINNAYKFMINSFIGSFNMRFRTTEKIHLTTSISQASNTFFNESGITTTDICPTEDNIYKVCKRTESEYIHNSCPIYAQTVDKSAMELHKLEKLAGGKLLKVKTDCTFVENPTRLNSVVL